MKKAFIPLALATALFTTGCKDSENIIDTPSTPDLSDHEAISFSMSDAQGASSTRAFYAEGLTRAGFDGKYGESNSQKTQILMHIESQDGSASKWKFTKTQAIADPQASGKDYSDVSFPEVYTRYWDDAHGRNSLLSIYAVAIPNLSNLATSGTADDGLLNEGDLTSATSGDWGLDLSTEPTHEIKWSVNKAQNATTLYTEDLVYSNNIKDGGTDGLYWFNYSSTDNGMTANTWQPGNSANDISKTGAKTHGNGRMQFRLSNTQDPRSAGKFDKGHLKFNHALSRITIKLVEGNGFNHGASSSDFIFTDATNKTINLYKMNYTGTLNLKTGKWGSTTAIEDATPIRITPGTKTETEASSVYTGSYQCSAQILPDYVLSNNKEENVLDFAIDNNVYYIQNKMLWDALNKNAGTGTGKNGLTPASSYTMEQGKNYVFTITVDKKQIESVTATIVDWSNVEAANENINNAHITFDTYLASATGDQTVTGSSTQGFHLFRLSEKLGAINTSSAPNAIKYRGAYTDEATATWDGTNNKWSTNWYFDDNKTAYHFRAINSVACYGTSGSTDKTNFGATDATLYSENTARSCTYFNMYNGTTTASDYHWGAPLVNVSGTKYYEYSTTKGYEDLIHKGITSTESPINITQLHMMSQINVIVRTTDQCYGTSGSETAVAASNAIALETGPSGSEVQCEVTLTRLYNHGTVDMGTGLITLDKTKNETGIASGIKAVEPMTAPSKGITSNSETGTNLITIDGKKYSTKKTGEYTFNVIPQELKRDGGTTEDYYVGITIKTPDNNQYYVVKQLSDILATSVGTSQNQTSGNENTNKITRWYPNHKYIYTFTITKKGIEAITCTLADWSEVIGENINIDLES